MISFPKNPNLAGEDVTFVRYENGVVKNWGHMHVEHIEALKAQGEDIQIVSDDWTPPTIEVDYTPMVKFEIARVLDQTDKYFVKDAHENISPETQAKWQEYRRALRAAFKQNVTPDIVAAIPSTDPYGNDPFKEFR